MQVFFEYIFPFGLLFFLLSNLYVGPTYFRRLDSLIRVLKERHPPVYEGLRRPSLSLLDMTTRSAFRLVNFVLLGRYRNLNDNEATTYGDAARWRLFYGMSGFLFIFLIFLAALLRAL